MYSNKSKYRDHTLFLNAFYECFVQVLIDVAVGRLNVIIYYCSYTMSTYFVFCCITYFIYSVFITFCDMHVINDYMRIIPDG